MFAILNVSQNWIAEMTLKQLGKQLGDGGTWRAGVAVERRFLIDSVRVDSTQISLQDGSGLSARNLVSPLTFTQILAFMRRRSRFRVFAAGIPWAGRVGTLRTRFGGTRIEGRVHAKTGSIGEVNTLSGYLERSDTAATTRPCRVFSVQANHHTLGGRAMTQAIDSLVVELARGTRCERRR